MEEKLITVAIHTMRYACALKSLLEREGVKATLQNVNLSNPDISAGVRVRIHESDLPVALRIIENPEVFSIDKEQHDDAVATILMPTDFSEYSKKACKVAFNLADTHASSIKLIHAFLDPIYSRRSQLNDNLNFDNDAAHDMASDNELRAAEIKMSEFESELIGMIKSGDIPAVRFSHDICEGIPEDVINQHARDEQPLMIVMGTRDAGDKARDLVGSVAAEVLDTCRFPVLTVPESAALHPKCEVEHVMFFSNFDQQDILAIDTMLRLLPPRAISVCFVKIPSKKFDGDSEQSLLRLKTYCEKHYPIHTFTLDTMEIVSVEDDFHRLMSENRIDMICVPNKKKNVFARFFNPGVAHRLLFQTDIPMLVIPI